MSDKKDIAAVVAQFQTGVHGVMVILRAQAFVELYGDVPQPGALLSPDAARALARQILSAADEAEALDGLKEG